MLWGANVYCGRRQLHNTTLMYSYLLYHFRFIVFNLEELIKFLNSPLWKGIYVVMEWNVGFCCCLVSNVFWFADDIHEKKVFRALLVFRILDKRLWTSTIFCWSLCRNLNLWEVSLWKLAESHRVGCYCS